MSKKSRYQGVTAFVGMPGSGKTYSLAEVGKRALDRGERVVCNAGFDLQGAEVMATFDEFAGLEGPCVVVWDELPLYFNARKWSEFPDMMLYKFTQIRKDGLQLYYSTIHEDMIDVNIRRVTFWYWRCRSFPLLYGKLGLHRRSLWPPEQFRGRGDKAYRSEWFRIRPEVAALYDTLGKVALPQRVRLRLAEGVPEAESWDQLAEARRAAAGPERPQGEPVEEPAAGDDVARQAIAAGGSWQAGSDES